MRQSTFGLKTQKFYNDFKPYQTKFLTFFEINSYFQALNSLFNKNEIIISSNNKFIDIVTQQDKNNKTDTLDEVVLPYVVLNEEYQYSDCMLKNNFVYREIVKNLIGSFYIETVQPVKEFGQAASLVYIPKSDTHVQSLFKMITDKIDQNNEQNNHELHIKLKEIYEYVQKSLKQFFEMTIGVEDKLISKNNNIDITYQEAQDYIDKKLIKEAVYELNDFEQEINQFFLTFTTLNSNELLNMIKNNSDRFYYFLQENDYDNYETGFMLQARILDLYGFFTKIISLTSLYDESPLFEGNVINLIDDFYFKLKSFPNLEKIIKNKIKQNDNLLNLFDGLLSVNNIKLK